MSQQSPVQPLIQKKGEEILRKMESAGKPSLFSRDFWYGSIMDWSMKNDQFKTQMFRFVDVLPSLDSSSDVAKHLKEYFSGKSEELPSVFNVGLGLGSLAPSLMAGAIRKNVTGMAKMFITGESPKEALSVLKKSRQEKLAFTVDLLGEATLSEKEAFEYCEKYMALINEISEQAERWDEIPLLDRDHAGSIPKVNVSVKLTALYSQINTAAWEVTKTNLKDRLRPLFRKAMEKKVFLNLDMEQFSVKDLTLEVFEEMIMEPEFRSYPHWGCVIQAYLKSSLADIGRLVEVARRREVPFTVRLVKGAYWDYEVIEANQKGWDVPVFERKTETDANFEKCSELLLKSFPAIRVAFGSHNVRSIAHALVTAEKMSVPPQAIEIQMLYGMAEPIKKALVEMGFRLREYAPIGDLIPGMAYLVRRLLENTSNESWLRGKFAEGMSHELLLRDPALGSTPAAAPTSTAAPTASSMTNPPLSVATAQTAFINEPFVDFGLPQSRNQLIAELAKARKKMQKLHPLWIDGKPVTTQRTIERENPSASQEILGKVSVAGIPEADRAMEAAKKALPAWRRKSAEERAQILDRLADIMVAKKAELTATQVLEVGKPWREADGDVAEAIDFCRYYAQDMRRLAVPQRAGRTLGELSLYQYQARGISLVIAPWNFPLAILAGMAAAAAVTGNTVIIKPAEQSSLVAAGLAEMIHEAGFPAGVINTLFGFGEEVGDYLVKHPDISTIAFTGSKAVGLSIFKTASEIKPGQVHAKKCIIEMGGKNAIIVDNDADLDEAVKGVLYSAFGFAGQKCSACSRVIVLEGIAKKFETRLLEAVRSIEIGPSEDPSPYYGPVVDKEAFDRIHATIEEAKKEHKLLYQGPQKAGGYFVPPTVFTGVSPKSKLAQQEIFGPVLAILVAADIDQALEIANGTEYALTGGLFSRSPANIEKIRQEYECGNLYINRTITGAMVERHPFGGFKMSGLGSKTGGPDYLLNFMEPRCVTENTMRRGFAPIDEV